MGAIIYPALDVSLLSKQTTGHEELSSADGALYNIITQL